MKLWRRVSVFWLCVLLLVPMLARPAKATEVYPDNGTSFWQMMSGWVGVRAWKSFLDVGVTEETATDEDWQKAYQLYSDDLKTKVGTATVINGGIRIYIKSSTMIDNGSQTSKYTLFNPISAVFSTTSSGKGPFVYFNDFYLPFDSTYSFGSSFSVDNCQMVNSEYLTFSGSGLKAKKIELVTLCPSSLLSGLSSFSLVVWVDVIPYTGVVRDYYNVDIANDTRVGTINGDYGIVGDNNTLIKSEQNYIVNETNNTVYNPATGQTYNITNWAYDYSTRSYDLTIDTGDKITVTYGDTNVTIKQGDTIYNVYYYSEPSGGGGTDPGGGGTDPGGGGTDPGGGDGDSIWDKLGALIGGPIKAIIGMVEAILSKVLDGLIALVDMMAEKLQAVVTGMLSLFDAVPALFGGFVDFFGAVFAFLPKEILYLLQFGFFAAILIGLIRLLLNR